jgi:beta-phosphoglucomutase-like phosphatase (HAD superfamily)
MIRAMIFDLDGTLVQTERLKAISYARAVIELCPHEVSESQVIESFKEVVGLPRRTVAQSLVDKFDLADKAAARMPEFEVSTPWQAFIQVRLQHYEAMLADPKILLESRWPHNLALLEEARRADCKTGLATMSTCNQAQRVLDILNLKGEFDFVATRDDVEHGKPNPEIYELVASQLDTPAQQCLVIEDSPAGVKAALAAGMWCIAVTTLFTRAAIHDRQLLDGRWVVDEPGELPAVVQHMILERTSD